MDETLKIYWKLYNEIFSNEELIHKNNNLLRKFDDEFIDGPILELGCGQSHFLVEFSKMGKEIFAIDNEEFQLNLLKNELNHMLEKMLKNYIYWILQFQRKKFHKRYFL